MSDIYFSDRERGPLPRTNEQITPGAWGGIVVLLQNLICDNYFADKFAEECPDGYGTAGTNTKAMSLAIRGDIPEFEWPLDMSNLVGGLDVDEPPPTLAILDLLELCYRVVAKPSQDDYHSYFRHHHLSIRP